MFTNRYTALRARVDVMTCTGDDGYEVAEEEAGAVVVATASDLEGTKIATKKKETNLVEAVYFFGMTLPQKTNRDI